MKRTFFSEMATGFLNTTANTIQARKQQEADLDKMRQESLLKLDVESQLLERKQKLEFKANEEKQRLMQQAFAAKVSGQTQQAMATTNPALAPIDPAASEVDDSASVFKPSSPIDAQQAGTQVASNAVTSQAPIAVQQAPVQSAPWNDEELYNVFASKWDDKDGGASASIAVEEFKRKRLQDTPEYKAQEAGAKKTAEAKAEIAVTGAPEAEFEAAKKELNLPANIKQVTFKNKPQEKLYETFHENAWAGKEAQENYKNNSQIVQLAGRFSALNKLYPTGGLVINTPGVKTVLTNLVAEYQAMDDVTKSLTMKNIKNLGSGTAISDSDRQYAEKVGLSLGKLTDANEAQAAVIVSFAQVQNEYADFMKKVASVQGDTAQAEKAWKEYINANPVFTSTKVGEVAPNAERVSPEAYFAFKEAYEQTPSGGTYTDPFGNIRTKK